jgi:hypothetical protein
VGYLYYVLSFSLTKQKESSEKEVTITEKGESRTFENKYKDKVKQLERKEVTIEKRTQLKQSFVMEHTTQGNILMTWDNDREVFLYYADHITPYRFLEVLARKFVVANDCKDLYIDMDDELQIAELKLREKKSEEDKSEADQGEKEVLAGATPSKKSVFAKLKSYNRDNTIKSVTVKEVEKAPTGAPPRRNMVVNTAQEDNMILKERANRYSYQGKIANFAFLKKVDRKMVDKNYAVSFAEFKRMVKK